MTAWDRALARLRADGEDVDALLERAARSLSAWRGRDVPFPAEALVESEREIDSVGGAQ